MADRAGGEATIDAAGTGTEARGVRYDGYWSPLDAGAPTFAGITSLGSATTTTLTAGWAAALDDITPTASIVYDIWYWATVGGSMGAYPDFSSVGGATSYVITGLSPGVNYTALVRARDAAGNRDTNVVQLAATTTADTTAPTFSGAAYAVTDNATAIVGWPVATDDFTSSDAIVYRVYRGTALPLSYAAPHATVTGDTYYRDTAPPAGTVYYGVRAVDAAGNADTNVATVSVTTVDVTAPTFAGITGLSAASSSSLSISWSAASDAVTGAGSIAYDIWYWLTAGSAPTYPNATVTGTTSATITGLQASTSYTVRVRARDAAGNTDTNVVTMSASTSADVVNPTFSGATGIALNSSNQPVVTWALASDDFTAVDSVAFKVYRATTPGGQNFASPLATLAGGVTRYVDLTAAEGTTYYYVIRAFDAAGNTETNTTEVSVSVPDTTAPTFAGVDSVTVLGETSALVEWLSGADDVTVGASLIYYVWCWETAIGDTGVVTETVIGDLSCTLTGLLPDTGYSVRVRAEDGAGNRETNNVVVTFTTDADTAAPTFSGAEDVALFGGSPLVLWSAASDVYTAASDIVYRVYRATTAGGQNFASPLATTAGGVTRYLDASAVDGETYYYVVRAVDEAGNEDTNTTEVSVTTSDTTAPTFAGVSNASPSGSTSVLVEWNEATDDQTVHADMTYYVWCWETVGGAFGNPTASVVGATSYTVTGLRPSTSYSVRVRAEDEAGNRETNTATLATTTDADADAPAFAGAVAAHPSGSAAVLVVWAPATDPYTDGQDIVYRVYRSDVSGGQDFGGGYETVTGATYYLDTAVDPGVTYYYVVRAVDSDGNIDTNVIEVDATTADEVDATAPVVASVSPAPGDTVTATTPLVVDVTDAGGSLRRAIVTVRQAGVEEVAHDGERFVGFFAALSSRSPVSGGWRYSLRRSGGWTSSPAVRVYAIDTSGNEATLWRRSPTSSRRRLRLPLRWRRGSGPIPKTRRQACSGSASRARSAAMGAATSRRRAERRPCVRRSDRSSGRGARPTTARSWGSYRGARSLARCFICYRTGALTIRGRRRWRASTLRKRSRGGSLGCA
jgi:fibronectin type 3 domain-containing protein